MTPSEIETYHGKDTDIALEVHHFDDGRESTYWIRSGIAAIQCHEDELRELTELLDAYREEELDFKIRKPARQVISVVFLVAIVALLIGVLINV